MTDASFEQQGKSKRGREHPEVPQAADSSSSGSSSESSTDTEMGAVDVCTILCVAAERDGVIEGREGGNSEVSKRDGVTGKPVTVAEGREGGPATLDLTKWDFNKADCRNRCRKFTDRFWWRGRGANFGGSAPDIHL